MWTSTAQPLQHTPVRWEHLLSRPQRTYDQHQRHQHHQPVSSLRHSSNFDQPCSTYSAARSSFPPTLSQRAKPLHSSREQLRRFHSSSLSSSSRTGTATIPSSKTPIKNQSDAVSSDQWNTTTSISEGIQTVVCQVASALEEASVSYCFLRHAAAAVRGASIPSTSSTTTEQVVMSAPPVRVVVQWDHMRAARQAMERWNPGPLQTHPGGYSSVTFRVTSSHHQGSSSNSKGGSGSGSSHSKATGDGPTSSGETRGGSSSNRNKHNQAHPSPESQTPHKQVNSEDAASLIVIMSCVHNTVVAADPYRVQAQLSLTASLTPASSSRPFEGDQQQQQQQQQRLLWVHSLTALAHDADASLREAVCVRLAQLQVELSTLNSRSWDNDDAYSAWVVRFGHPREAAAKIKQDPVGRLSPLMPHLLDWPGPDAWDCTASVPSQQPADHGRGTAEDRGGSSALQPPSFRNQMVINLMGSHGHKAVAMALLDANVVVVDVSHANARYGMELATAAGVADRVRYAVCDMLALPGLDEVAGGSADVVMAEQGILHYFVNIDSFMGVAAWLLKPGGRLVLRDFHPVSTKLLSSRGKKHKATGNYFDQGLVPSDVAFTKHSSPAVPITEERKLPAGTQPLSSKGGLPTYASGVRALPSTQAQKPLQMQAPLQVLLRQWTLGEIVTSVARSGLVISCLEEEQGVRADDAGHPKTFTLVAMKALS